MSKLLSKGGFGCVYYPGLNCSGGTDNDTHYVTKLQAVGDEADREISISNIIKKIDNFKFYFAPVISWCKIDIRKISEPVLRDCDILDERTTDCYLMRIPYVDKDNFFNFITRNSDKKFAVSTLLETMKYLLSSIHKLISNNIVHFDLKGENIVYLRSLYIPVIIDFGISMQIDDVTMSNLNKYFYKFAPDYYVWPLEVHFLAYLANEAEILSLETIELVCHQSIDANKALIPFSPEFKEVYYQNSVGYFSRYVGQSRNKVISSLLKSWNTWDLYSFGILILKTVSYLFEGGYPKNKFMESFILMCLYNIHYDPNERNTITDNINYMSKLYYRVNERVVLESLLADVSYTPSAVSKQITLDIVKMPT
jgi:serine/threonine protein kinase